MVRDIDCDRKGEGEGWLQCAAGGWMDGRMGGWADGRMGGWANECVLMRALREEEGERASVVFDTIRLQ